MKLAIATGVWKRPEVFKIFARGMHELRASSSLDITVIVAGSEGIRSRTMVEQYPFYYIEVKNDPLAAKMNATTLYAQSIGADYVLCVGSDDIIHPGMFRMYEDAMKRGIDFTGCLDFYFCDLQSKRALYWAGYADGRRKGHTAGPGRMLSAKLMDACKWQPWQVEHSHILDNSMQQLLLRVPHTEHIFSMLTEQVYGLDIKSATNMTPFQRWDNTCEIDAKLIKKIFPYVWN